MTVARGHDLLVGRALGEFVLRERIGEGGFGGVYRAIQAALDREAVVKVMHARLRASPAASERFLREAKLASKLDHPYAAHIYAFGVEPDGESWIAMELVRGTPLDAILRLQGPLPLERFVPLLDRICEVVHTAHEQGIVHRDLKPANVMVLSRAGRLLPKLLDFGIAKGLERAASAAPRRDRDRDHDHDHDHDHDSTVRAPSVPEEDAIAQTVASAGGTAPGGNNALTQVGAIMGSPPYMAPEQWLDAGIVDGRTDLYALACLAFECLTGRPPFVAKTVTQMAIAHAKDTAPPLGPKFAPALDKVLAKALAKDPAARYTDALALAAAFRQASGVGTETVVLPALDAGHRDAATRSAPQPIAEAVAAIDAARNPHQAQGALVAAARTIARYLGLVALACRSRVSGDDEPAAVTDALRAVSRGALADKDWLALALALARSWHARRDAYPLPELVDALCDGALADDLVGLLALRDRELAGDDALIEQLERAVVRMSRALAALAFLADYPLVVPIAGGFAERWTGVAPRTQRATIAVRGKDLPVGAPALVDASGVPVLALAPLFCVAPPTPGAPPELFMFEGRDGRGGKLVSLPAGFEVHDDGVIDWLRGQLTSSLQDDPETLDDERPPYRGLQAFSVEDSAQFFGREHLVDALVNRLKLQPLIAVVGRSGAGKSSFVHAGVVPALPTGWRAITARPGASPLRALIARLDHAGFVAITPAEIAADRDALGNHLRADAARRGPLLVVIDQLEEIFTLCGDDGEREAFAEALATAARSADDPVRVVFTLRDDFLARTEQLDALRNRIGQGLQLLAVPGPNELRRIVVEPARRAGYELEGDLADVMVREVAGQPGALALLSFTAQKLWELRDRHFKQLTRAAYKTLGGVAGALAKHADVTLEGLRPDEQQLAREAFRHLVTSQGTRAVLAHEDLKALLGGDAAAERVIERLVAARLLVASENETGEHTIEIVHEALLSAWPRLVEWQREHADGARFREQLRTAAQQWQARGRGRGMVWRGDELAELVRWRARHKGALTELEAAFADASAAEAVRGRRIRRALLAAAFAALVAVVIVLVVSNTRIAGERAVAEDANSRLQANLQRQYENQGRRLLLDNDPLQALAYLAKARELGATGPAHDFLVAQAAHAMTGELHELPSDSAVRSVAFSPDGRVVAGSIDGKARVWDARTGTLQLVLEHKDALTGATFSRDGTTVLTASYDGTAAVWEVASGRMRHRLDHARAVRCADLAPDGKLAVTAAGSEVVVWALADGTPRLRLRAGTAEIVACALAPDGSTFAAGDSSGATYLWDLHTGQLVHHWTDHRDRITGVAFAPDATRLVASSEDGTAAEWRVGDGVRLHVFGHRGAVRSARFSPDGRSIVTASSDYTARVWDADTGAERFALEGHTAEVSHASYSPDGKYVATASADATAWLWAADDGHPVARWRGHDGPIADLAFAPDGAYLATAGDDGRSIVWNPVPQETVAWLPHRGGNVADARFSANGTRLLTAAGDAARVWDVASARELHVLTGHTGDVTSAALSPDGARVVTGGADGSVRVWDVGRESVATTLVTGPPAGQIVVDWSPDGRSIAAADGLGWIRCWDASSGALRFEKRLPGAFQFFSASFDPTSSQIATAGADRTTRFWSLSGQQLSEHRDSDLPVSASYDASGRRMLSALINQRAKIWNVATGTTETELVGHVGVVGDAKWSPDGRWVITAAADHTVRIWDAETGEVLSVISRPSRALTAAFSPDGERVVVGYTDGAAVYSLHRHPPPQHELDQLLACRVPFEVRGDRIVPRVRDAKRCAR